MELEVGEGEVQMCLICVDCEGVIFLTLTLTLTKPILRWTYQTVYAA